MSRIARCCKAAALPGWLLMAALSLAGCNIISGVVAITAPPELVEAKYELPDKKTLIVIDDRLGLINNESMLRRIGTAAQAALEAEEVVTEGFVSHDKLTAYREELGEKYDTTSLAALGNRLEAKQVIHAEVVAYQMEVGGGVVRPAIVMTVKVFDMDTLVRMFPASTGQGSGLNTGRTAFPIQTRLTSEDLSSSSAAMSIAARELADTAGRDLGRLFFDWRMPERGSTLGER